MIDEICDIIGHHHHPREKETLNFQILYEADWIVNMEEKGLSRTGRRFSPSLINISEPKQAGRWLKNSIWLN